MELLSQQTRAALFKREARTLGQLVPSLLAQITVDCKVNERDFLFFDLICCDKEIHGGSEIPPVKSNYHILIRSALIGCHKGADPHRSVLTPSEIYGWCQRKYTYYAERDSYNASWKSALRHHLTAR